MNLLDEKILMSTHDIHFMIKKIFLNIHFLELSKECPGTEKRVRISQSKRVVSFRVIGVLLYFT